MFATTKQKYLTIILPALLLSACNKTPEHQTPAPKDSSAASLQARLDAAKLIVVINTRDEALSALAKDAALAKNVEVAKRALEGITVIDVKDRAAESCALAFSKVGEANSAKEMAQLITFNEVRDRTLSAIAKGQY